MTTATDATNPSDATDPSEATGAWHGSHPGRGAAPDHDLRHHGDQDLAPGLVDLAVNVRRTSPPAWLAQVLASTIDGLGSYPDPADARRAIAARHGVEISHVLPTSGGAEAFTLLARSLRPMRPLVVHPQFTEPEAALVAAGHRPQRHLLDSSRGFPLDPEAVDPSADLVVVGNPTNPTGVLHPATALEQLRRPGRVLVVDEAFMDAVPGEPESLIGRAMDGVLVLRSLTKTWGLAGLRAGYVVGDPALVERLRVVQPPWSVSSPALAAMVACSTETALAESGRAAQLVEEHRGILVAALSRHGFAPAAPSGAPFVLIDTSALGPGSIRAELAALGLAVRRGETFPGLGPTWIRVAVRTPDVTARLVAALRTIRRNRRAA